MRPKTALPITIPYLGEAEKEAACQAIASNWITTGPRVNELEDAVACQTGAVHACALSNCTVALQLSLAAVGTRPGDVVLTVSHSFVATANAVRLCGAEPVFVDIDAKTYNMDPEALGQVLDAQLDRRDGGLWFKEADRLAIGSSPLSAVSGPRGRLAAILPVHQFGLPADLGRILDVSRPFGLPVVEDAACAIGSQISLDSGGSWEPIGKPHGELACFSFHPRKIVTTGEGGVITSKRAELDDRFRRLRQHGTSTATPSLPGGTGSNCKLTDIQAAIGVAQMARLGKILARRQKLAGHYNTLLSTADGIEPPFVPDYARPNWQSYATTLKDPDRRSYLMSSLERRGIATLPGIVSAHTQAPYRDQWRDTPLPQSEIAQASALLLPLFPAMTEGDVERVVDALKKALK